MFTGVLMILAPLRLPADVLVDLDVCDGWVCVDGIVIFTKVRTLLANSVFVLVTETSCGLLERFEYRAVSP